VLGLTRKTLWDLRSSRESKQEVGRESRHAVFELGSSSNSKRSRSRMRCTVDSHVEKESFAGGFELVGVGRQQREREAGESLREKRRGSAVRFWKEERRASPTRTCAVLQVFASMSTES